MSLFLQKYESLFATPNKFMIVNSLNEFLTLPKSEQVNTLVNDRSIATFPIKECGESLFPLNKYLAEHNSLIQLVAGQASYGAQSLDMQRLRAGTAERLLKAEHILQSLDSNITFKITDSYRPIRLQKKYFDEIYTRYASAGLTGDELYARVTQVIADPECHPPHSTGGTLDLTLIKKDSMQELDMGSQLDDVDDERAATFHPALSFEARKNRLLLYSVMIEAGFVNSPSEWWHYTYGTQEWAMRTEHDHAIYDSV